MVSFTLNAKRVSVDADPATPLLWVIRDHVGLTGTKYGCGAGLCGACTVHLDGKAVRACQTQVSEVANKIGRHHRGTERRIPPIRCRKPGWRWKCRNAATASPARS